MFDHDYPGDGGHEYETMTEAGAVRVSKVGGGTIGRAYQGAWHYHVRGTAFRGSDLVTGSPTTHHEAAQTVADFYDHHRNEDR